MSVVPLGKECFQFIDGFILCMLEVERACGEQGPLARWLGVNSWKRLLTIYQYMVQYMWDPVGVCCLGFSWLFIQGQSLAKTRVSTCRETQGLLPCPIICIISNCHQWCALEHLKGKVRRWQWFLKGFSHKKQLCILPLEPRMASARIEDIRKAARAWTQVCRAVGQVESEWSAQVEDLWHILHDKRSGRSSCAVFFWYSAAIMLTYIYREIIYTKSNGPISVIIYKKKPCSYFVCQQSHYGSHGLTVWGESIYIFQNSWWDVVGFNLVLHPLSISVCPQLRAQGRLPSEPGLPDVSKFWPQPGIEFWWFQNSVDIKHHKSLKTRRNEHKCTTIVQPRNVAGCCWVSGYPICSDEFFFWCQDCGKTKTSHGCRGARCPCSVAATGEIRPDTRCLFGSRYWRYFFVFGWGIYTLNMCVLSPSSKTRPCQVGWQLRVLSRYALIFPSFPLHFSGGTIAVLQVPDEVVIRKKKKVAAWRLKKGESWTDWVFFEVWPLHVPASQVTMPELRKSPPTLWALMGNAHVKSLKSWVIFAEKMLRAGHHALGGHRAAALSSYLNRFGLPDESFTRNLWEAKR